MGDIQLSRVSVAVQPQSYRSIVQSTVPLLRALDPDHLRRPGRLDVLKLVDRLEDYSGVLFTVRDLSPGEEGYADPFERELVVTNEVYKGASAGNGRDRQTICHEIGHVPHIDQLTSVVRHGARLSRRDFNVYVAIFQDPEWQAHNYARALLMPPTQAASVFEKGGIAAIEDAFGVSTSNAEGWIRVLREKLHVIR